MLLGITLNIQMYIIYEMRYVLDQNLNVFGEGFLWKKTGNHKIYEHVYREAGLL